jgi:hypothetical protein
MKSNFNLGFFSCYREAGGVPDPYLPLCVPELGRSSGLFLFLITVAKPLSQSQLVEPET